MGQDFANHIVWKTQVTKTLGCLFVCCVHYEEIEAILVDCHLQI